MLKNYFKTAFRNLLKGRLYSILNLAGLTVGTATVILLALFVRDEWTFDQFHENSDRIYRAWVKEHYQGEVFFNTVTPYILGSELRDNFPEIKQVARYFTGNVLVKKGQFSEQESMHVVESEFLTIFDFELVRGIKGQVFNNIHNVVLTEEMGEKYFGDPYPMGQTLTLQIDGEWTDFTISGIIEKAPGNSSLQYNLLIPFEHTETILSEGGRTSWTNVNVETYVLLDASNNVTDLEAKVAPFIDDKVNNDYKPGEYIVGFQPLTDIHLNSDFPLGSVPVSDARYPRILAGVALLILLLAAINFTSIAVGRSMSRAKEVGVRRVTGAARSQLMTQFWTEAILTAGISVLAGILLVRAVLPFFNLMADKQLTFDFSPENLLACLGLVVVTGLLSGAYPAVVQSGFSPIQSLRGSINKIGNSKHQVLRGLVGFQFLLSILLIACTLVMAQQMRFLQNTNLGFSKDQIVTMPYSNSGLGLGKLLMAGKSTTERLRNELAGKSGFKDVTWSNHTFGTGGWMSIGYTDEKEDVFRGFSLNGIDSRFIPMLGIEMIAGRVPDPQNNAADEKAVVINEAYAQMFQLETGEQMQEPFKDYKVVGIAKDFHFASLHTEIEPIVLAPDPVGLVRIASDITFDDFPNPKISVKISGQNIPATLSQLRMAWTKVAPEQAFAYTFLDENLDRQYRSERRFAAVMRASTILAIFIASLGLIGIATLTIARRRKEIGVRKILGATTTNIVVMLSKNFTWLVLMAAIVALPIAWYAMSQWLDDFAYRITVSPITLGLGALGALILTWVVVGWQSIRAALINPVESLRSE